MNGNYLNGTKRNHQRFNISIPVEYTGQFVIPYAGLDNRVIYKHFPIGSTSDTKGLYKNLSTSKINKADRNTSESKATTYKNIEDSVLKSRSLPLIRESGKLNYRVNSRDAFQT